MWFYKQQVRVEISFDSISDKKHPVRVLTSYSNTFSLQELKFISQLIQHADFDREELADVFKAMFVTR